MNEKTERSLQRIIDYLYPDELRHWEELGKPKEGHIFVDVQRVSTWFEKNKKPEVVGRGRCPNCRKLVTVVYGPCDCEKGCPRQTWVCARCGCGMCPDAE
jgi:hypothetical protein